MSIDWEAVRRLGDQRPDPSIEDLTIRSECDPVRTVDELNAAMGRARPRERVPLPGFRFDDSADTTAWLESGRFAR